jgi:2-polyprenyl-3-methyl-5-hydroxy-6-metoxy-1,4-benzoquinol methylase
MTSTPGNARSNVAPEPTPIEQWRLVDAGWGRNAVEFATLSEPANRREYVAIHHRLGVSETDRLLDVACGSGLAIELAALRGASCAGIDASEAWWRLPEIAVQIPTS